MTEQTITEPDWADVREMARQAGFRRKLPLGGRNRAFPGDATYFRTDAQGFSQMSADGWVATSRDYLGWPRGKLRVRLSGPGGQELLVDPAPRELLATVQRLGIGGAW